MPSHFLSSYEVSESLNVRHVVGSVASAFTSGAVATYGTLVHFRSRGS